MTTLTIVERYGKFLAITATTTPGFYTITHLPTGHSLTGRIACLACCRWSAEDIASYKRVPWSTLTVDNRHDWFRTRLPVELFDKLATVHAYMGDRCWANCPKVIAAGERVEVPAC
ncbi:hypothetical protein AB0J14_05210 [Micromonospora arborensis]|uniref:hypothetical protein n=1 Tax=Micromonospora arborensis TaxID=2116518 RepID=UPI00340C2993